MKKSKEKENKGEKIMKQLYKKTMMVVFTVVGIFVAGTFSEHASADVPVPEDVWTATKGDTTYWHINRFLTMEEGAAWAIANVPEEIRTNPIYNYRTYIDEGMPGTFVTEEMDYAQLPQEVRDNPEQYGLQKILHGATNKADAMKHGEGQYFMNGYVNQYDTWFEPFDTLSPEQQAEVLAHPEVYNYHEVDGVFVCNIPIECWMYYTYKYSYTDCVYKFGVSFKTSALQYEADFVKHKLTIYR
jgi:hypothetical protein